MRPVRRLSSDGGVLLFPGIERRLGIADLLASCVTDERTSASTTHTYADMIRARMFAIACGYEDCDDLDVVRFNPAFKLACGRVAETGDDLMSQPTLSRLENAPSWRQPGRMGPSMIDLFCASFKAVPERIVLDIDDTDDAVHGGPQLALFNAHYDEYIFQPIHIFEATTGKPVLPLLRPGKRPSGEEAARILKHVIRRIRRHWPRVEITVRGDGHYGTPDVMELLEDQGCNYIFGPPGNARLSKTGQPWCEDVAVRRVQRGKDKLRRFFRVAYRAMVTGAHGGRPRRGNLEGLRRPLRRHQSARQGQGALREGLLRPGQNGKHNQGSQALHQIRPNILPPLGGQPVPPVPAHRRLLATAPTSPGRAPPLAVAQGDVRNHPPRLPQDRRAHRGAQIPHQDRPAVSLSISAGSLVDGRSDTSPRPLN